jgi:hypothetical protein
MAQDDVVHRGTGRYEWVVSPGAEGAHGCLLAVSIGDVPDTMSGPRASGPQGRNYHIVEDATSQAGDALLERGWPSASWQHMSRCHRLGWVRTLQSTETVGVCPGSGQERRGMDEATMGR